MSSQFQRSIVHRIISVIPTLPVVVVTTLYTSVANYRPISITPVLSKVFERLVAVRLGRFMEHCGVLLTTQFAYRKGLGTCDAILCASHTLQSALESGPEDRIVQINFMRCF